MSSEDIKREVAAYYTDRVTKHGATPQGADWSSAESQEIRFRQLADVIDRPAGYSINDYGCGYGALLDYLVETGQEPATYTGLDISEEMLAQARERLGGRAGTRFTTREESMAVADYTVASGIFNVKLETEVAAWDEYIFDALDRIAALSRRGFAFNLLTSYSDADRMRPDLYYGDPCAFFDRCKRRYSRQVALRHDYGLWEWTIVVRLELS